MNYEDRIWERIGTRHPGGEKSSKELLCLAEKYGGEGKNLLNLGCGDGNGMELWRAQGYQITGSDISEMLCEKAAGKHPDMRWIPGDAVSMYLGQGEYDCVLMECTLSILKEQQEGLLSRLHTALRRNGLLLISDTCLPREHSGFQLLEQKERQEWVKEFLADILWEEPETYRQWIKESGCSGREQHEPKYFVAVYRRC